MSQRLIMPFKKQMMLCGYKNPEYAKYWGYPHYGVDISTIQGGAGDDPTVYASGNGIVLEGGEDSRLGYGLCVLYSDTYNHKTGQSASVVARYMHLSKIMVKTGDVVKTGAPLAVEGKEGTADYHLHIEFDTDIAYPRYSPQVAGTGGFWVKGTDSTIDPSHLFYVGTEQEIVKPTYNPAWLNADDFKIPYVPVEKDYKVMYERGVLKLKRIAEIINE